MRRNFYNEIDNDGRIKNNVSVNCPAFKRVKTSLMGQITTLKGGNLPHADKSLIGRLI